MKKIIKNIKNIFIPNLSNAFHPYILRAPALATVTASLLLVQVVFNLDNVSGQVLGVNHSIDNQKIVELTNQAREQAGVAALTIDPKLQEAAQAKAQDMLEQNYWSHYSPDGQPPWVFLAEVEYSYRYAGENLAKGFSDSDGVVKGWLASESHRHNMLNQRFSEVGIAAVRGYLDGQETNLIVAMYGSKQPVQISVGDSAVDTPTANNAEEEVLAANRFYSSSDPLTALAVIPISSQIALFAANGLATIYVLQHIIITRHRIKWDNKAHPRPLLKAIVIVAVAVLLIYSAQGAVY
ncbi:MAG: CAP domain-containing protein [Candidatus Saccharimonadales bacterium]